MARALEYMVLENISKGQTIAADPNRGGVIRATPTSVPLGTAKRDLKAGEIIRIILGQESEDVSPGGAPE